MEQQLKAKDEEIRALKDLLHLIALKIAPIVNSMEKKLDVKHEED